MSSRLNWRSPAGQNPGSEHSPVARASCGHPHFGRRALSRRQFLWTAAGTAAALGTGLLLPTPALAAGRNPRPIPGGIANPTGGPFVHANFPPGPVDAPPGMGGGEQSSITDFDGFIGSAGIQGTGTGTN